MKIDRERKRKEEDCEKKKLNFVAKRMINKHIRIPRKMSFFSYFTSNKVKGEKSERLKEKIATETITFLSTFETEYSRIAYTLCFSHCAKSSIR